MADIKTVLTDEQIDRCLAESLEEIAASHGIFWNEVRTDIDQHATLRRTFGEKCARAAIAAKEGK